MYKALHSTAVALTFPIHAIDLFRKRCYICFQIIKFLTDFTELNR